MSTLANGIAHVSFRGGGAFLPVRSPYDQELFVEHVTDQARVKGIIQMQVGIHRWLVDGRECASAGPCRSCGRKVRAACCSQRDQGACCVRCALAQSLKGDNVPFTPPGKRREDSPPLVPYPRPQLMRAVAP